MTVTSGAMISGPYLADGIKTEFGFTFKIKDADHLQVVVADDAAGTNAVYYTSGYTVDDQWLDRDQGGLINFTISGLAVASGKYVRILGNAPYEQEVAFTRQGPYNPLQVMDALDNLAIQNKQTAEKLSRAVVADPGVTVPSVGDIGNAAAFADAAAQSAFNADVSADDAAASAASAAQSVVNIVPTVLRFSGNGVLTTFPIGVTPDENFTSAYVNGVYIQKDKYSIASNNIVFTTAPANGVSNVEVVIMPSTALAFASPSAGSIYDQHVNASSDLNVAILHARFENILSYLPYNRHAGILDGTNAADLYSGMQDAAYEVASKGGRLVFPGRGPYLTSQQVDFIAQVNGPEPDFTSNGQFYVVSNVQPIVLEASHEAIIKPLADMESIFNIHWNGGPTYFHQAPWYSRVRGFFCDARGLTVDRFVYVSSGFGAEIEHNRVVGPDKAFYADGSGGFKIAHNRFTTKYGFYCPNGGGDSRIYGNDIYPRDGGAGLRLGYYGGDTQIFANTFTGNGQVGEIMRAILLQGNVTAGNTLGNIDIAANEFNAMLGVEIIEAAANPNIYNISIHHNHTAAYGAVNRGSLVKATGVSGLIISENFGNWLRAGANSSDKAIDLTHCEGAKIRGNHLQNYSDTPILITDCLHTQIEGNFLHNFGMSSDTTKEGIRLAGNTFRSTIKGNKFVQDSASYAQRGVVEASPAGFNNASDNEFQTVGTGYVVSSANSFMHRVEYGYAAPVAGTWRLGDRIINESPTAGGTKEWICTTSGTPGTWTART